MHRIYPNFLYMLPNVYLSCIGTIHILNVCSSCMGYQTSCMFLDIGNRFFNFKRLRWKYDFNSNLVKFFPCFGVLLTPGFIQRQKLQVNLCRVWRTTDVIRNSYFIKNHDEITFYFD